MHEHSLGNLTNTIAGIVGGLAGYAVYAAIPAMVNGAGNAVVDTSFVNELVLRALSAFVAGGVLALIVTFRENAVSSTQTEMSGRPLEESNDQYCDLLERRPTGFPVAGSSRLPVNLRPSVAISLSPFGATSWAQDVRSSGSISLHGAGSTFAAPLYKKWIEEYARRASQRVDLL